MRAFAFCALLALAPLPFVSIKPWAWSALALAIGALWLACAIADLRAERAPRPGRAVAVTMVAALGFALWIGAQSLPLAPLEWRNPHWDLVEAPGAISVDPNRTLETLCRALASIGAFCIAFSLARDHA